MNGDLFGPPRYADVSRERKLNELIRELGMRKHVYPKLVQRGEMTRKTAADRIFVLEAIIKDYSQNRRNEL